MKKLYSQGLSVLAGIFALGGSSANIEDVRSLRFFHTHTQQTLDVIYFRDGSYDPDALVNIRMFMADWRDGEQTSLDPGLMDILWQIEQRTEHSEVWEVISAYRSPQTNEMLRAKSNGVARKSQHLLGNAIDVRLRGLDLKALRDTARNLELGGVGYYPGSDFVHLDTGRVRYW